jgi:hypothetical protein
VLLGSKVYNMTMLVKDICDGNIKYSEVTR